MHVFYFQRSKTSTITISFVDFIVNCFEWDEDKSNIVHTEFIVNDKCKETDTSNEDMFEVIAYITTLKVMIQGKEYEMFGAKFFSKRLNLVNEYVTNTDSKQIEVDKLNLITLFHYMTTLFNHFLMIHLYQRCWMPLCYIFV
jgi:hypothetical protein